LGGLAAEALSLIAEIAGPADAPKTIPAKP
jgi:hypothetical protein